MHETTRRFVDLRGSSHGVWRPATKNTMNTIKDTTKPATTDISTQLASATGDLSLDLKTIAEQLDAEVLKVIDLPADQMIEPILKFMDLERSNMQHAEKLTALSRLHCWATGQALIGAKKKIKRGKFESWIKANFSFSKSSAENYMKLARDYPNAMSFLEKETPLRQLYADKAQSTEDCAPAEDAFVDSTKIEPSSKIELMLNSLTNSQKCMRHVTESEEQLDDHQIGQFDLVFKELERYRKIITKNTKKS